MTKLNATTVATTMSAAEVLQELRQAENPLRDEMARGRGVASLAEELSEAEPLNGARYADIVSALEWFGGKLAVDWSTARHVASFRVDGVTVSVMVGKTTHGWYVRTIDGVFGDPCRDEADDSRYASEHDAVAAAHDIASSLDEDDEADDDDDGDDDA